MTFQLPWLNQAGPDSFFFSFNPKLNGLSFRDIPSKNERNFVCYSSKNPDGSLSGQRNAYAALLLVSQVTQQQTGPAT